MRSNILILLLLFSSSVFSQSDDAARKILNKNAYGDYNTSGIGEKVKNFSPQMLSQGYKDTNVSMQKFGIDAEYAKKISNVTSKDARETASRFYSKENQSNIESMKGYILEDETFKYKGVQKDIVDKSKKTSIGMKAKNSVFPAAAINEKLGLDGNERIFIYVSSSMPEQLVKTYLEYADKSKGVIRIALRGFVGGAQKIGPTQEWVRKMVTKEDGESTYKTGIEINPQLQKEYSISQVPAVLYIKDYSMINEAHTGEVKKSDDFWIAYGAVDLLYALEEIQKDSKSKTLPVLIKNLRGDFYQ